MGALNIEEVLGRQTIHPFPARMAPGLALAALSDLKTPATILDPMVGSGTVVAIARAKGHRAIGFDVDPLAVMVARVWTRTINPGEVRRQAQHVLVRSKKLALNLTVGEAYPAGADPETRAFVRYWFDPYARIQLAALAISIAAVPSIEMRELLWCSFSRLIIAKQAGVSLAMDLAHSRPHRVFKTGPRKPLERFLEAVERVVGGCIQSGARDRGPVAIVRSGDVRQLPLADKSVDLVFTSPPYLNAIDYLRCSKFSLVWMGYSTAKLRAIRAESIGAEVSMKSDSTHEEILRHLGMKPALPSRAEGILRRYISDTSCALKELRRVLAPRGQIVYVVGENTVRGTYIPTGRLVSRVAAEAGLQLVKRRFRELPSSSRYLPPPGIRRTALDTRMRREVILTFERSSRAKKS